MENSFAESQITIQPPSILHPLTFVAKHLVRSRDIHGMRDRETRFFGYNMHNWSSSDVVEETLEGELK